MDRKEAEVLLQLAGVAKLKANGTPSRKYDEKLDQLIEFRLNAVEVDLMKSLPIEILEFMFNGVLTQSNRKALFEGMRGDFTRSCKALHHLNRGDLISELNRLCGYVVEKSTWEQSEIWNDIGLSLAAGTEEDPLVFFGKHGH